MNRQDPPPLDYGTRPPPRLLTLRTIILASFALLLLAASLLYNLAPAAAEGGARCACLGFLLLTTLLTASLISDYKSHQSQRTLRDWQATRKNTPPDPPPP